jgi:pyruvate formate lyase activating enzyme
VTAFHQDYRMNDPANTTPEMLLRAARIGQQAGLRYVYAGNLPGRVGALEDTRCHHCGFRLIARYGYLIREYNLTSDAAGSPGLQAHGVCPQCRTALPGRWDARFAGQRTAFPFAPADRTRLRVI